MTSRQVDLNAFINDLVECEKFREDELVRQFLALNDPRHQFESETDDPYNDTAEQDDFSDEDSEQVPHMKVTKNDFHFSKILGRGLHSRVYLATHKSTNQNFAIKQQGKSAAKSKRPGRRIMAERDVLLKNLKHPFLVGLHYSFQTKDKLYFVMDYVSGGELFFYLQKEKSFKESRARFYAAEISSALGFLHSQKIIYRDLKPQNLLMDKDGHIVITDFGVAIPEVTLSEKANTMCGTLEYMAPEVIKNEGYTFAVDWWGLGVVLYEMIFGQHPFYLRDCSALMTNIIYGQLMFKRDNVASLECQDILLQLMLKDPDQRLGSGSQDVADIENHPFFEKHINFDALLNKQVEPPFKPTESCTSDSSPKKSVAFSLSQPGTSYGESEQSIGSSYRTSVLEADNTFLGFSYARPLDNEDFAM